MKPSMPCKVSRSTTCEVAIADITLADHISTASSYTLPLLPGYGANVKVRSSVAPKSPGGGSILHKMDAAEETGYVDSYFPFEQPEVNEDADGPSNGNERSTTTEDGQIYATSPEQTTSFPSSDTFTSIDTHDSSTDRSTSPPPTVPSSLPPSSAPPFSPSRHIRSMSARSREPKLAEAIFFDYGVSVFFGFTEGREKDILEDCERGGTWVKSFGEEGGSPEDRGWEMEECHFVYDPQASYPRIVSSPTRFRLPRQAQRTPISYPDRTECSTTIFSPSSPPLISSSYPSHMPLRNQRSFRSTSLPYSRHSARRRIFPKSWP